MTVPLWRLNLQPASFRGAHFQVESSGKQGGRRIVLYEFPKKDQCATEDMGLRAKRFRLAAYIVNGPEMPDYQTARDKLVTALETNGPGQLITPTLGVYQVVVDHYSVTETKDKGGMAIFEIEFIEAGTNSYMTPSADTNGQVGTQADQTAGAAPTSTDISAADAGTQAPADVNPQGSLIGAPPPAAVLPGATLPPVFG